MATNQTTPTLRQKLGCWAHERWRAELVMRAPWLMRRFGWNWIDLHNRHVQLRNDPVSGGRVCCWEESSRLTLSRVFPKATHRLLRLAFGDWPVSLDTTSAKPQPGATKVSFLIPIGGSNRMAQFGLALDSARTQVGIAVEIIVIEQSAEPILAGRLPPGVRHFHQPLRAGGFNKSRAINLGAREAKSEYLIILDADYVVPQRFAVECARILSIVESARPVRWIVCLDQRTTETLIATRNLSLPWVIEHVVSNNPMPLAVRRSTYWEVGGHDEDYVGWGGEDVELLNRLRTRSISEGGLMPIIHAWHPAAEKKASGDRNRRLHNLKMAEPERARIERLLTIESLRTWAPLQ